jgi:NAD(P)-dependent dehydrogenase (short-subunit alcohol dehydrogenase family)
MPARSRNLPTPPTPRLIVLTGATRGLGRAMAEGFAAAGHTVVGCGRSAEAVGALTRAFGPPHRFDVVDVCSDGAVAAWAKAVLTAHGAPDLLINNAAVINRPAPLWTVAAPVFDAVLDTNVKGIANVIRHFGPAMVATGRGVIVNFSSGWGRSVDVGVAPYCATKWAVEGLTQALALDLPEGMAAVPLNPGIIDTDMLRLSFGRSAGSYPSPAEWAARAVPFILKLGPRDNGQPLTVR